MLKTLSLTPDEARDSTEEDETHSESRMLKALKALSGNAPQFDQTETNLFRTSGQEPSGRDESRRDQNNFRPNRSQPRELHRENTSTPFNRTRHRFVKDGEVPVVHMAVPRPRDAAVATPARNDADLARLQQLLDEQRAKFDLADKARQDALQQLRMLQTKSAHTDMALADATRLAESRLHEIAALEEKLRLQAEAVSRPVRQPILPPAELGNMPHVPRKVGRPRTRPLPMAEAAPPPPESEPEPVQWWLTPVTVPAKRGKRINHAR